MISWKMPDGSMFVIDEMQEKAFNMKIEAEGITEKQAKEAFIPEVERHWASKTIPTKFDSDEPWEETYRDMAMLADDVLYPKIRSAMMALMFAEMSKKEKKPKEMKVIALSDRGGATEYRSDGKVKRHKTLDSALPKKKRRRG